MLNKRSMMASFAITGFVLFAAFVFTGCDSSDKTEVKTETATDSTKMDSSKMKVDTTFKDSADTRPVKTPD